MSLHSQSTASHQAAATNQDGYFNIGQLLLLEEAAVVAVIFADKLVNLCEIRPDGEK